MAYPRDDPSLGELFSELTRETSMLARQEVQLAKAELRQSAEQIGRSVAALLVGGAVAYAGFLAIIAAVILALVESGMSWWLSALIVGVVVAAIGIAFVMRARAGLQPENLAPKATIASLKEDQEWVREQIR